MIFNENKLQEEIIKTWGEFGVHNEVFTAMRKQISDLKQLTLTDVGSSNKVDYKQGFELAQNYIDNCPCDPDIYKTQLEAWDKYQKFLIDNNIT